MLSKQNRKATWVAIALFVVGFIACSQLGSGEGPSYGELEAHECAKRGAC